MMDRHPRRGNGPRSRRRTAPVAPEALEGRALLAFSPLGYSLPDLAIVEAFSAPIGAYGGPIAVTVDVSNLGQSSIIEPLAQFPGAASTADAGETTIAVYYTNEAHAPFGQRVLLGTIDVPAIPQNRLARVTGVFELPEQPPAGFPVTGQTGFLTFELDPDRQVRDFDRSNNFFRPAASFVLVPELPELEAIALELPQVLSPGDVVIPQVKVANYGAAFAGVQSPVIVQVVASLDPFFGPGDEVLGTFTVDDIAPLSTFPTKNFVPGDQTIYDQINVVTLDAEVPVALPDAPTPYFIGVVVDPFNQILELGELDRGPDTGIELIREVHASALGLPPAGVIGNAAPTNRPFPFPPFETPTGTPTPEPIPVITRGAEARQALADRQAARALRLQALRPVAPQPSARVRPGTIAARLAARRSLRGF